MMECKGALKMRWTATEVAMLIEEWSNVCACPNGKSLKGEDLSKAIFERYNARCARTRQLRRSPQAVATQRVRMIQFARFVVDFDRTALALGRTAWFDLSDEDQLQVGIPNELRRQLTTFTQEMFNTFKQLILPTENAYNGAQCKKTKKLRTKHKKASSQSSNSQQRRISRLERPPCWTTQEKVLLAQRWGAFMKHEQLTLKEFEGMTFDKSCTYLASSTRSAFSAWRKSRTLLSSWRFISTFNEQHKPGWFKLTESERELLITWTELPDDFDDIELEVFVAMNKVVSKCIGQETEISVLPAPLTPKALTLHPTPLGPTPTLALCPKNGEPAETDDTLDRLLLEDDEADNDSDLQQHIATLGGNVVPDACILLPDGESAIKRENASNQTESIRTVQEELELTLNTDKIRLHQALRRLRSSFDQGYKRTLEYVRAGNFNGLSGGITKHVSVVLEQQNERILAVLRLADETCTLNDVEMQSLKQVLMIQRHDDPNDHDVVDARGLEPH